MDSATVLLHLVFLIAIAWGLSTLFVTVVLSLYPIGAVVVIAGMVGTAAVMGGYLPADPITVIGGCLTVLAGTLLLSGLTESRLSGDADNAYGEDDDGEAPQVTITGSSAASRPMGGSSRDSGLGGGLG